MDLAIVGLGIMGRSLALNFERQGYAVAGYDINPQLDTRPFHGKNITIFPTFAALAAALSLPRRILLLVPAGLLQAQRDYFGAHRYERVDQPGTFHTEWE